MHGDHGWGQQGTIEYGRQRYLAWPAAGPRGPHQHKNIFKPFFRLDKSRNLNHAGVGLGLAIVEDVVNSHGGNIQLSKSKFNGLQFKISLPF